MKNASFPLQSAEKGRVRVRREDMKAGAGQAPVGVLTSSTSRLRFDRVAEVCKHYDKRFDVVAILLQCLSKAG